MNLSLINSDILYNDFCNYLYGFKDSRYLELSRRTIPGEYTIFGVRMPILKKLAKEIYKGDYNAFLNISSADIHEIKLIEGFVISHIKDYNEFIDRFCLFKNKVDNWAVCDSFASSAKIIKKHLQDFYKIIEKLLYSESTYDMRLAYVFLLNYYVIEDYVYEVLKLISNYELKTYYVDTAYAWLVSKLYMKYPKITYEFLEKQNYDKKMWSYIRRKILDSYSVSSLDKEKVKMLYLDKIKEV